MKTKLIILTVLFFGVLISGNLFSQNNRYYANNRNCVVDDLSDEQKTKIEAIRLQNDKKVKDINADMRIKKAELHKLQVSDNPSKNDINKKIDEISVLRADIQKENASKRIEIRNELTPEQRVKHDLHTSKRMYSRKDAPHFHKHGDCDYDGRRHSGNRNR